MLAIITVVYENYTVLKDFLNCLEKQSTKKFHVFLVDLSETKEKISFERLEATVIEERNKGYSFGVNIGIKEAMKNGFSDFCVINNDVIFKEDFIIKALDVKAKHPSSIVAGKIYYAKGFEYHKDRYRQKDLGNIIWYAGGKIDWNHALTPHRGVDEIDRGQFDHPEKIDFANGALMLFDKTVVDTVGLWNENYFLYFEDADFCVRAKRAKIPLWYEPALVIWHKNAQSTGGSGSKLHQKYQRTSRLRFGLTYAPFRTKIHLLKNFILGK